MGSDSMNQQQLLPSGTRRTAAARAATTVVYQHTEQQQQRQQHSVCINTCNVYNTSDSSIIPDISGPRGTWLWNHMAPNKKRWKKTIHQKKKNTLGIEPPCGDVHGVKATCSPTQFFTWRMSYWYVYVRTNTTLFTLRAHVRTLTNPYAEASFVAVTKGKTCSTAVVPWQPNLWRLLFLL